MLALKILSVPKPKAKRNYSETAQFILPSISLHQLGCDGSESMLQFPASAIHRERSMVLPLSDLLSIAAICRKHKPERVFELGTFTGSTTRILAMNLAESAEIFTLDLDPQSMPDCCLDASGKPIYEAGVLFKGTAEALKIRQLFGNSAEFDFSPYFGSMDLVFVDADHSYEAVLKDSQTAFKLLRPGGMIVWDDYRWLPEHSNCEGVTRALHELADQYPIYQLKGTRLAVYRDQGKLPHSKRILVVSNFYPPNDIGGYELGCADIVNGLKANGHDIKVLTGYAGQPSQETEKGIYRWLDVRLHWPRGIRFLPAALKRERRNQRRFRTLLGEFDPEIIYFWNMTNGCSSLLYAAPEHTAKRACYVSGNWYQNLLNIDRLAKFVNAPTWKKVLSPAMGALTTVLRGCDVTLPKGIPHVDLVQFASHFLKNQVPTRSLERAKVSVCHWGVEPKSVDLLANGDQARRLLYVGQIMPHKGVHTLVKAFAKLSLQPEFDSATLTLVGGSSDESYLRQVKGLAESARKGSVVFRGKMPRHQLPEIYRQHDVFVLPSEWDEPFSISLLEAMSQGLAVVGTLTGGTGEILIDGETGVVFPQGDAVELEKALTKLLTDNQLFQHVRKQGLETIGKSHRITQMISMLEQELIALVDEKMATQSATFQNPRTTLRRPRIDV